MGGSKWIKVKMALGLKLNSCLYVPRTVEEDSPPQPPAAAVYLSPASPWDSDYRVQMPTTPTPSSSGLQLPKHSSKSCKKICAICLTTMKPGHGHAIFTAECAHSFHFHCITSNVKHGKQICPVCRAKWKEIPFQSPSPTDKSNKEITRINNMSWPRDNNIVPSPPADINRNVASFFHATEPTIFNDDDKVSSGGEVSSSSSNGVLEVKTYPEVSAVPKSKSHDNFSILIHLKAPPNTTSGSRAASIDLVTVLDVSGSMAGTKLALLKRAMGFVIQNLGPSDRLSVIAFSSTALRLFPLRRMSDIGKHEALQAINSLKSNGGTNIAEALRKGAKMISDRKWKNPVCNIILLSDGQDTYNTTTSGGFDYYQSVSSGFPFPPIHTFGFGEDHDAFLMHSISENSGGTFSFIEEESVIQDAFAQCIGGLLSVVVQELNVEIECIDPMIRLLSIKSGSYKTMLATDKKQGTIQVGDLYAEEERDFLVTTHVPTTDQETSSLIKVRCIYRNLANYSEIEVKIQRPLVLIGEVIVSIEVDKQRNRLTSAEAMEVARSFAEKGDLASAMSIIEKCRKKISKTLSAGDRLCVSLDAELREMQERMANQRVYETSGRAYMLSGLSSHSWQRATARGDSTDSTSLVQAYQTQSMVDMVNLSQTMVFRSPPPRPTIRPTRSFNARGP